MAKRNTDKALSPKRDFHESVEVFLREVSDYKAYRTYLAYNLALTGFSTVCKAQTLEDIARQDVLSYIGEFRKKQHSNRTISNHTMYLKTFFKHFRVEWQMLKTAASSQRRRPWTRLRMRS